MMASACHLQQYNVIVVNKVNLLIEGSNLSIFNLRFIFRLPVIFSWSVIYNEYFGSCLFHVERIQCREARGGASRPPGNGRDGTCPYKYSVKLSKNNDLCRSIWLLNEVVVPMLMKSLVAR